MPYLQLFVPLGKSESEAQAILNYLRDNFPLKQSEGRVHRVAANFILFEQPEHTGLTLEQEVLPMPGTSRPIVGSVRVSPSSGPWACRWACCPAVVTRPTKSA